ncbi:HEAT repeat domain-containing protein [uncultured Croceitalea sp.]|uniref:HEAT repeat domain-containing protein n=1 Tax=uncultured Croceitalea sp. TaxID=1798908 RepID=UPI003305B5FC
MDKEQFEKLIPDYLEGNLSDTEKSSFEKYLATCEACQKELDEYRKLYTSFDEEVFQTPSKNLEQGFLQLLEEEKQKSVKVVSIGAERNGKKRSWFSVPLKVAASIAVLLTAFMTGRYAQNKEAQKTIALIENESLQLKQTTMISLMQNQSASKRIQGVQFIEDFEEPDEAIVDALTERMLHDENTNVRLTAVEALSKFANAASVKTAFIKALGQEKDPSVQIAIIQNLVKTQEKKAVEPMKKLLKQEDTQPFVKEQINQVLLEII